MTATVNQNHRTETVPTKPGEGTTPPENGAQPAEPAKKQPKPGTAAPDPRYLALRNFAISMSVFNILGYTLFGFEQPWLWPILALLTAYSTEMLMETVTAWAEKREPGYRGGGFRGFWTYFLPAHITGLAVNLLLYANTRFLPIMYGIIIAILGKTLFRAPIMGRMRHFMNPSNLGITAVLLTFPWVNIAPPYHFTENVPGIFRLFIPMVILTAGTVLNAQLTKKTPMVDLGRGDPRRAVGDDRRGVRAVHQLHDHRPGHVAVPAAGTVHVRRLGGDRVRDPDGVQRRLHAVLRGLHRLRGPRPVLVGPALHGEGQGAPRRA
jgi:hypothetical protein